MSITAANLTDGIRVDQATQKGSVYDVIHLVCNKPGNYANQVLARVEKTYPELTRKWCKLRINGKGRETPVASVATLVEITWLCPGKAAMQFRRKGAETVCRVLGGDLTLVDEIQRRHAQVAGTAEQEFLLADTQGNGTQVALPELPYSMEQLQQMQAAAAAIVASKEDIQQCAIVLHGLLQFCKQLRQQLQESQNSHRQGIMSDLCYQTVTQSLSCELKAKEDQLVGVCEAIKSAKDPESQFNEAMMLVLKSVAAGCSRKRPRVE